jgi:hypothetical protein
LKPGPGPIPLRDEIGLRRQSQIGTLLECPDICGIPATEGGSLAVLSSSYATAWPGYVTVWLVDQVCPKSDRFAKFDGGCEPENGTQGRRNLWRLLPSPAKHSAQSDNGTALRASPIAMRITDTQGALWLSVQVLVSLAHREGIERPILDQFSRWALHSALTHSPARTSYSHCSSPDARRIA